jgi:hypothetical protein
MVTTYGTGHGHAGVKHLQVGKIDIWLT